MRGGSNARTCGSTVTGLIARRDGVIIEIHVTVGLGPQADATRYRVRQNMLKVELAVEIALDILTCNTDLEIVPLTCRRGRIADPLHGGALAFLELPKD